ncbi:helix-turn-helix domain-containing protein [uncultured Actinomyces sp.]|uniref:helix-turn-helix domain-containing protein n=1 Tax=uncultured Actinomyces sp. TaxID=249061 RepID=UPI0026178EDD|nr:helix-turn-helix domain-containing protein [uncultured Actinomyces sp.]
MLSVEDRAAIMVGLEAALPQARIARSIGHSPSVVCREIARHLGPGGVYKAQDADRAAQVAKRRPKKRLLDRDEALRRRVITDLSQRRTPRQISARLSMEACSTVTPMDNSPHAQGHTISHEAIYTWIDAPPQQDADRARHLPALQVMDA